MEWVPKAGGFGGGGGGIAHSQTTDRLKGQQVYPSAELGSQGHTGNRSREA